MPINATPVSGLSDHINDVRSHTGRGADELVVTNQSLRCASPSLRVPDRICFTKNVLHHYEKNESWGSSG
jgi:hypothetical protein